MSRYTKKPVTIDAAQWTGDSFELCRWASEFPGTIRWSFDGDTLIIPTLEGDMRASIGDWIIRGVKGEFYPCKPDIFAATYEPAAPPPASAREQGVREDEGWTLIGEPFRTPPAPAAERTQGAVEIVDDDMLDNALAAVTNGHTVHPEDVEAIIRHCISLRAARPSQPDAGVEALRDFLRRSAMASGQKLPECAGGLAYWTLHLNALGPAQTWDEALNAALRAATPSPDDHGRATGEGR